MQPTFWLGTLAAAALAAFSLLFGLARGGRTGQFLGIPYDWRRPTVARLRERVWNPDDPRVFTPKTFGWGWDINFGRLWRLLRERSAGG